MATAEGTLFSLTPEQASAMYEGLDVAVTSETDLSIGAAIEAREKLGRHLELAEQLHAVDRAEGCEMDVPDTAAALRVLRDLITYYEETVRDDVGSLLGGPKCSEDQKGWPEYANAHGESLKRDLDRLGSLCEVLAELSIVRATEVEVPSLDDCPPSSLGEQGAAEARKFLGEEEQS